MLLVSRTLRNTYSVNLTKFVKFCLLTTLSFVTVTKFTCGCVQTTNLIELIEYFLVRIKHYNICALALTMIAIFRVLIIMNPRSLQLHNQLLLTIIYISNYFRIFVNLRFRTYNQQSLTLQRHRRCKVTINVSNSVTQGFTLHVYLGCET